MADFERSTPDASRAALLSLRNRRARELGAPFAVVERAGRGQCVVASREIAAGAIILRERPLFAQQYAPPWPAGGTNTNLACAACLAPAADLATCFAHLAGSAVVDLPHAAAVGCGPGAPCARACGVSYCSAACAARDAESHEAVCASAPTPPPTTSTGLEGLEYFRLGARVAAAAHAATRRLRDGAPAAADDAAVLAALGGLSAVPFDETLDAGGGATAAIASAAAALRRALCDAEWLSDERFGLLLGQLRLNCQTVRVESPLLGYFESLGALDAEAADAALAALAEPIEHLRRAPHVLRAAAEASARCVDDDGAPEEDEALEASAMFPSTEGIALFTLQSAFNHSCEPNCLMTTSNASAFAEVIVVADRALAPGEELCFDYLVGEQPSAEKRAALEGQYRFRCDCAGCSNDPTVIK